MALGDRDTHELLDSMRHAIGICRGLSASGGEIVDRLLNAASCKMIENYIAASGGRSLPMLPREFPRFLKSFISYIIKILRQFQLDQVAAEDGREREDAQRAALPPNCCRYYVSFGWYRFCDTCAGLIYNTDHYGHIRCQGRCELIFHSQCEGINDTGLRRLRNFVCSACENDGYGRTAFLDVQA